MTVCQFIYLVKQVLYEQNVVIGHIGLFCCFTSKLSYKKIVINTNNSTHKESASKNQVLAIF